MPNIRVAVGERGCGAGRGVDRAAANARPAIVDMAADVEAAPIVVRLWRLIGRNPPSELRHHGRNVDRVDRPRKREPDGQRLERMDRIIHHPVLADRRRCGRGAVSGKAHGEQAVSREQRAVGVAGVIGGRVEQIERVELDAPPVREPIADGGVDGVHRRRLEDAVLSERPGADVAPAQRAEPAGVLAERDARRRHHPRRFINKIAGSVADLGLRKAGEGLVELLLSGIEPKEPGPRERQIRVDAKPRHRSIVVGELDAGSLTGQAGNGAAGVAVEEQLRVLVQVEKADRAVEPRHDLGANADLGARRAH